MATKMLINAGQSEEYRIAVVKGGELDGFYLETSTAEEKTGNIYKGIVDRVDPSLEACFVNFGDDRNGFLQASEIHPEYFSNSENVNGEQTRLSIEKRVKKGQELLVQVVREMPGRKGAQLTTYLSLAGRYLVLTPGKTVGGISRKIEEEEERARLKSILGQFKLPEGVGYIVRTAGKGQSKRDFSRDLNRLLRMWNSVKKRAQEAPPLTLIHKEQDVCLRTLRDYFTGDISEVLVDDKETYTKVKGYMKIISPKHQRRVKLYKGRESIFDHYQIEKQIEDIYSNRVNLKSGGSIVIDPTEALISIDVNSGKGKGGKDVEDTAFQTNMEAAAQIARQLRLRDMGGLVVIDFIDMKDRRHLRETEKLLREETKKDKAKIDMTHISKFGLLELSRQRLRPSIESRAYQTCPYCEGRGLIQSVESLSVSLLRQIHTGGAKKDVTRVKGILPVDVAAYLQNRKRRELVELENRYGLEIVLETDPSLPPGGGGLEFSGNNS